MKSIVTPILTHVSQPVSQPVSLIATLEARHTDEAAFAQAVNALIPAERAIYCAELAVRTAGEKLREAEGHGNKSLISRRRNQLKAVQDALKAVQDAAAAPDTDPDPEPTGGAPVVDTSVAGLSEEEARVFSALSTTEARHIDAIAEAAGMTHRFGASQASATLLLLELKRLARRLPGGMFEAIAEAPAPPVASCDGLTKSEMSLRAQEESARTGRPFAVVRCEIELAQAKRSLAALETARPGDPLLAWHRRVERCEAKVATALKIGAELAERDAEAPAVEVLTICPSCEHEYCDTLNLCPQCEEVHPERAAEFAELAQDNSDPFADVEEDAAPVPLTEAESAQREAFNRAAVKAITPQVNADRRAKLERAVDAAGGITSLYYSEAGVSDADAAFLGHHGAYNEPANVTRRAKRANDRINRAAKAEKLATMPRRGDLAPVPVVEVAEDTAYLVSDAGALELAEPVASEPEPVAQPDAPTWIETAQAQAFNAAPVVAEPPPAEAPRPGFLARLKSLFARKPAPVAVPVDETESEPEPAAPAFQHVNTANLVPVSEWLRVPEPQPVRVAVPEPQPEPVAVPALPVPSEPRDCEAAEWARDYVAQLQQQHPARAAKLERSLAFQLQQLATAPDALKWKPRAEAAFLAKITA